MKHTLIAAVMLAWGFGQWMDFKDYKPREVKAKGASLIADVLIRPG
jgi:hypothetical protein